MFRMDASVMAARTAVSTSRIWTIVPSSSGLNTRVLATPAATPRPGRGAEPRREQGRVRRRREPAAPVVHAAVALGLAEHCDHVAGGHGAVVDEPGQPADVVGAGGGQPMDLHALHRRLLESEYRSGGSVVPGRRHDDGRSRANAVPMAAGSWAVRPKPASIASDTTYGVIWITYELTGSRSPCTRSWSASAAPKSRHASSVPNGIQRPTMMAASAR